MSGSQSLSPVTLEVVRHAIYAIADEMSLIIMRSARSTLLKETGDLSSALTDARGRLIAQGRDIPIHLGVMAFTVKEFLRRVPRRELRDGDVWYLNLPEVGGNHLPDVKAIRPVFAGGRLVAFAINLAHWVDIGGAVPGSYVPWADEAIQEGLRIAPIKVFDRKGPTRALDFIMANVRGREEREGDCRAMYSAVEVGARRLGELFEPLRRHQRSSAASTATGRSRTPPCGRRSAGSPTASTRVRTGSTTTATRIGPCRSG